MYQLEMMVRDYECDLQGVVNNANYLNYFEHARHRLFEGHLSFSEFIDQGINFALYSAQIKYLSPLKPDDIFLISTQLSRHSKLKLRAEQTIILKKNNQLCCEGIFEIVLLNKEWKLIRDQHTVTEILDRLVSKK
jgi:acyl-CoA thioester hydrolase